MNKSATRKLTTTTPELWVQQYAPTQETATALLENLQTIAKAYATEDGTINPQKWLDITSKAQSTQPTTTDFMGLIKYLRTNA